MCDCFWDMVYFSDLDDLRMTFDSVGRSVVHLLQTYIYES